MAPGGGNIGPTIGPKIGPTTFGAKNWPVCFWGLVGGEVWPARFGSFAFRPSGGPPRGPFVKVELLY